MSHEEFEEWERRTEDRALKGFFWMAGVALAGMAIALIVLAARL